MLLCSSRMASQLYVYKEKKITHHQVERPTTKKYVCIIGVLALLGSVLFSGCQQISDLFLTDEKRFLGTWLSEEMVLEAPTVVVFSTNDTVTATIDVFEIQMTLTGEWTIQGGKLTMLFEEYDFPSNYSYQFSDEGKTLTLTTVDGGQTFLLQKQQQT